MNVDDWVLEAVGERGKVGATLREIQRYIDEHHFEELAVDTLQGSLERLEAQERLEEREGRYTLAKRTSAEDAAKRLFGEDA